MSPLCDRRKPRTFVEAKWTQNPWLSTIDELFNCGWSGDGICGIAVCGNGTESDSFYFGRSGLVFSSSWP